MTTIGWIAVILITSLIIYALTVYVGLTNDRIDRARKDTTHLKKAMEDNAEARNAKPGSKLDKRVRSIFGKRKR